MLVKITPNDKGNPPGKLAEAELHFSDGPLEGLKLIGFAIWERRGGGGRNVTFPARQYVVNGDRRSFALLRPIVDVMAQEKVRLLILEAYAEYEDASKFDEGVKAGMELAQANLVEGPVTDAERSNGPTRNSRKRRTGGRS